MPIRFPIKTLLPLLAVAALIVAVVPVSRSVLDVEAPETTGAKAIDWQLLLDLDPYTGEIGSSDLAELDGEIVTLVGYAVPIDFRADDLEDFILAPYLGACIHVPPPPPEQMVLVTLNEPQPMPDLWMPLVVTGRLHITTIDSPYGAAGYSLEGLTAREWSG